MGGLLRQECVQQRASRPLLRTCLDWTERRHHLSGRLGAALLAELRSREWVLPARHPRALRLTADGAEQLQRLLGLDEQLVGAAQHLRSDQR